MALTEIHPCLCSLFGSRPSKATITESPAFQLHLLSLPPPPPDMLIDAKTLTLASTYLIHALTILTHLLLSVAPTSAAISSFSSTLAASLGILSWIPFVSALPTTQTDSIVTRAYTVLTKCSSAIQTNHREVFLIRMYGLSCLAHASIGTVEANSFWDQATKSAVAFLKSVDAEAQDDASRTILQSFSALVSLNEQKAHRDTFLTGKGFCAFCECWMGMANSVRLSHIAMTFIDNTSTD